MAVSPNSDCVLLGGELVLGGHLPRADDAGQAGQQVDRRSDSTAL